VRRFVARGPKASTRRFPRPLIVVQVAPRTIDPVFPRPEVRALIDEFGGDVNREQPSVAIVVLLYGKPESDVRVEGHVDEAGRRAIVLEQRELIQH
jgi:hypothetical protein